MKLMPAEAVAVLGLLLGACVGDLRQHCWRAEYDERRCCTLQDPSCWDAVFTPAVCCPDNESMTQASRSRGNPRCWQDGYTFEECCLHTPKVGCWDSEFRPETCCVDAPAEEAGRPLDVTNEAAADAYSRLTGAALDSPLGCEDTPPGLWRMVKVGAASLNVSRSYGMPGEKPDASEMAVIVGHVLSWARDASLWESVKVACPVGAMNAIDLSVTHMDREVGEERAREVYRLHHSFRHALIAEGLWPPAGDWPLLSEGFEYVPKLLGLSQVHSCHQSPLRLYVYALPKLLHMLRPVLTCSQKMSQCTASVHIHRWLMRGTCLTNNPDEADLFYVPAYEACYNETACGFGDDTERCFPEDFDPTVDLPYFARRRGADHLFVFGCNLLPFRDTLMRHARQSIMITVESYQAENLAGPNMLAWLSLWKDVLIPGYIPRWRIEAMLSFNRPMARRPLLVAFHGHSSKSPDVGHMYRRSPLAGIRDEVISYFWNASRASVGPPVRDYFRRMGMSQFCIVPAGLTAWTIHLYEAFFLGCVPVILSDELTVPFQGEIDWMSLSLHVPTSTTMADLHTKLLSFSLQKLEVMYRGLMGARCWFDYSRGWDADGSSDAACSPYQGLLTALQERTPRLGGARLYGLSQFWGTSASG